MNTITKTVPFLILAISQLTFAQNANKIMKKVYSRKEANSMKSTMIMALRDANGNQNKRVLFMCTRKTRIGTDSYTKFLTPADVKGTKFLTIGNKKGSDDQRLWLPALGRIRKIASSGKKGKFMGSDLTYYDMEDRDFGDGRYTFIKEDSIRFTKDGNKKKQACWVIAVKPTDRDAPYSKTLVWVSKADYFIYKSEMYGLNGRLDKRMYIISAKTMQGIIIPIKMLVSSTSGHKTLMLSKNVRVNGKIDHKLFTIRNLQR
jgi:outer membrane lipoprotein-sorting protein